MREVIIVGAGPAGLFCALELLDKGVHGKDILIIDAGKDWKDRVKFGCPRKLSSCKKCKTCNILYGFGGAGGFSDGKINLSKTIGGDIDKATDLENYFSRFMITLKGLGENLGKFLKKEHINPEGVLYHLGTDGCHVMLSAIRDELETCGVTFWFNTFVDRVEKEDNLWMCGVNHCNGTIYDQRTKHLVLAIGRTGNALLERILLDKSRIIRASNVDVGLRVEMPARGIERITNRYHEFKLRTEQNGLKLRTFCVNPFGYVVNEYLDGAVLMNGHSYHDQDKRSDYTNFAILASIPFYEARKPNQYALDIARMCARLNGEGTISQKLIDFMLDRKTSREDYLFHLPYPDDDGVNHNPLALTYMGANGNLNFVLPERVSRAIKEAMREFSKKLNGELIKDHTWVHGIEAKCYSNKIDVTKEFEVVFEDKSKKGLFCIGDGSGWTRGLAQAAVSGMVVADSIVRR